MINRYKGIALIQVLIISVILSLLAIFITQTVQKQVQTTSLIKDNHDAHIILATAEAELMQALLTNKRYTNRSSESSIVNNWNFFGKPFQYGNQVTFEIQDYYGLLSVNHIRPGIAQRLFNELGQTNESKTRQFLDSLADWKDSDDLSRLNGAEHKYYQSLKLDTKPRNGYIQSISELFLVRDSDLISKEHWEAYFSIALISKFNPIQAPEMLLKAFLADDSKFTEVMTLRNDGTLNQFSFYEITGIEPDNFVTFSTGRLLKIKITVNIGESKLTKRFNVEVRVNSTSKPVTISDVIWNE